MIRSDLVYRVRRITRDFNASIFHNKDIIDFINEGIDRFKQIIPEFADMVYLVNDSDEPILLPSPYHHLLAVYSASRCFAQDERHYQATTMMNEFEVKLEELKQKIEVGELVIYDESGNAVEVTYEPDYVVDNYYDVDSDTTDLDDGVEGVE